MDSSTAPIEVLRPTDRQIRMLAFSAIGMTWIEIAQEVCLSKWTVKETLDEVRELIGARNITQAVAICFCEGFLTAEDLRAARADELTEQALAAA